LGFSGKTDLEGVPETKVEDGTPSSLYGRIMVDANWIKTAPHITLKPNRYFNLVDVPYHYQKRMILMMLIRPRMINGDDVGLGKTIESVVAFSYMKAAKPETRALVLTEKGALRQWKKAVEWLTPGLKARIISAGTHPDPTHRVAAMRTFEGDMLITTYSQIYKYWKYLLEGMGSRWILFADEPNYFNNTQTELHRRVFEMVNLDKRRPARGYGMTATIVENRLEEVFGTMRIVTPGTFVSQLEFERKYCIMRKLRKRNVRVCTGYKNLDLFRAQIEPFFYGRLADDPEVEQELPEVLTKDVEVICGKDQSRLILESMDRLVTLPDGATKQLEILPALMFSQQMANDPRVKGYATKGEKLNDLREIMKGSLSRQKVIIYSKFRTTIDQIEVELEQAGLKTMRITGKESEQTRYEHQMKFLDDNSGFDILLGTRAISKAMDLQSGGHLIFYDMPWAYGQYRQTIGRIKRTGSKHKAVAVYRMLAVLDPQTAALQGADDETVDHHALGVVMKKQKLWAAVTGDVETIESSTSDVMEIFEAVKNSRRV